MSKRVSGLIALTAILCCGAVTAQQPDSLDGAVPASGAATDTIDDLAGFGPSGYELGKVVLPSLEQLYANAEQNPGVLALEKQKEFEELQLKREKRNFLSFLNVNANYYYGNGTMSSHLYDESGMPIPQNYSRQSQFNYNLGASVSIPLEKLFDLRGSVKRQRKQVEKVEYERQSAIEERRGTIATIYSKVLSYMPILKATTEKRVFADAQYAISQNDFINSKIGASEINVEKERQIKAITEYENVRSELYGLLLQLEILSNTEIISKK